MGEHGVSLVVRRAGHLAAVVMVVVADACRCPRSLHAPCPSFTVCVMDDRQSCSSITAASASGRRLPVAWRLVASASLRLPACVADPCRLSLLQRHANERGSGCCPRQQRGARGDHEFLHRDGRTKKEKEKGEWRRVKGRRAAEPSTKPAKIAQNDHQQREMDKNFIKLLSTLCSLTPCH